MTIFGQLGIQPEWLLAAGIALLAFVLMRRAMRQQRRSRAIQPVEKPDRQRMKGSALLDAPDELIRWQVEMHDTARDLKAEIDSKISALQTLLLMAQQERQKLELLLERAEGYSQDGASRPRETEIEHRASAPRGPLSLPGTERQRADIYALAERGLSPHEIAEQLDLPIGEVEFLLALRVRS